MAANSASGTGHVPTGPRGNDRVSRFATWKKSHKNATLAAIGVTLDDYRGMSAKQKHHTLNRALDKLQAAKPKGRSGGGGAGEPAFDRNDPNAFTAPMGYNQALRQANSAANLQYGPQQQILDQQASNIPSWFDQYRASLQQGQAQAAAQNAPLIQNAQTAAQNSGKTVLQDVDPNSDAAHNDVLAAAARKAMGDMFANLLGANQQATTNYLAGRTDVANLSQTQAQNDNTAAKKQLAAERGNFVNTTVANQREAERKGLLENAAFNLDTYQAESGAANDAAKLAQDNRDAGDAFLEKNGVSRKTWRNWTPDQRAAWKKTWNASEQSPSDQINQAKLDYFNKHGYFPPTGKGGGGGPSASQVETNGDNWTRAQAYAKRYARGKLAHDPQLLYQFLLEKYPTIDPSLLNAAAQLKITKRLGPKNRAALRSMGIKVKVVKRAKVGPGRPGTAGNGNVSGTYPG